MVRGSRGWQEEDEDQAFPELRIMMREQKEQKFALCVRSDDCEDLELRKVYQVLPDERAKNEGYLRIVDDSGEDYLYPESYFVFIKLPRKAQQALVIAG